MSIEANKEASQACIDKARIALQAKDYDTAERLLNKSIRLSDNVEARVLLKQLKRENTGAATEQLHNPNSSSAGAENNSSSSTGDYTAEQEDMAKAVVRKKDYYAMLDLEKGASEADIKKAYRKMALKLHPDKNRAPSAEEAFKCVSKAYECLSDPQKREMYDQVGPEGMEQQAQRGGGHGHHPGQFFSDELTPEDIFNMFFHGIPPQGGRRRGAGFQTNGPQFHYSFGGNPFQQHHQQQQQRRQQAAQNGERPLFAVIMQYLPLIVFIILMFFPSGSSNSSLSSSISLDRSSSHTILRQSRDGIRYYVQPHFNAYYINTRGMLNSVEDYVLKKYVEKLDSECVIQQKKRDDALARARKAQASGSDQAKSAYEVAYSTQVPACDELEQLEQKFRSPSSS